MRISFALLVACLVLAACSSGSNRVRLLPLPESGVAHAASLPNTTRMTTMLGHGTQVTYFSGDGDVYLWYPENAKVLRGQWNFRPAEGVGMSEMCFRYGANSFNPVTRRSGGDWQCADYRKTALWEVEVRDGDVFRLGEREPVPFVLPAGAKNMNELLQRCTDC